MQGSYQIPALTRFHLLIASHQGQYQTNALFATQTHHWGVTGFQYTLVFNTNLYYYPKISTSLDIQPVFSHQGCPVVTAVDPGTIFHMVFIRYLFLLGVSPLFKEDMFRPHVVLSINTYYISICFLILVIDSFSFPVNYDCNYWLCPINYKHYGKKYLVYPWSWMIYIDWFTSLLLPGLTNTYNYW